MKPIHIKYKKQEGLILPSKAKNGDFAYDIVATSGPNIVGENLVGKKWLWKDVYYIEYGTNLFIEPVKDDGLSFGVIPVWESQIFSCLLFPRSSISKYNLYLANCVPIIDNKYRGELKLRFRYIFQPNDLEIFDNFIVGTVNETKIYQKGDKIVQLAPFKNMEIEWEGVDELSSSDRKDGGFGSTGV